MAARRSYKQPRTRAHGKRSSHASRCICVKEDVFVSKRARNGISSERRLLHARPSRLAADETCRVMNVHACQIGTAHNAFIETNACTHTHARTHTASGVEVASWTSQSAARHHFGWQVEMKHILRAQMNAMHIPGSIMHSDRTKASVLGNW